MSIFTIMKHHISCFHTLKHSKLFTASKQPVYILKTHFKRFINWQTVNIYKKVFGLLVRAQKWVRGRCKFLRAWDKGLTFFYNFLQIEITLYLSTCPASTVAVIHLPLSRRLLGQHFSPNWNRYINKLENCLGVGELTLVGAHIYPQTEFMYVLFRRTLQ